MSRPKHQHWVPQFYLRYFSTPETRSEKDAQVWMFSKDEADGNECLTNIRNACGKRYLYTPVDETGARTWDLESKLDQLESTMGKIWPQVAEGFVDLGNQSIRKGLALFAAVMHLRNPEVRRLVKKLHQQLVEFYESGSLRPDGTPAIDHRDWHKYRAWGKNDHDKFFAHIVENEAIHIAELLMKKRWAVVFSGRDVFITSDRPVAVQHLSKNVVGFGTENAIITFPLSPKRILVMDDQHEEPSNQYYPLQASNGGAFNHAIWSNGSRFMITGRAIHDVLSEIVKCADADE